MEVTKGYKTTEFWLGIAAVVISAVLAAGIVPDGSLVGKLIGIASVVLTSLGYTVSRGLVKASATKASAIAIAAAASNPSDPAK